jgi:hypothetical protein
LRRLFGKGGDIGTDVPEGAAVRVTNLKKLYNTKTLGFIGRNKDVTAIEDLSFDVPKVSYCPLLNAELRCRERSFVFSAGMVLPSLPPLELLPNCSTLRVDELATLRIYISGSQHKKMSYGTN